VSAGDVQTASPDSLFGPFLLKLCDVATTVTNVANDSSVFLFPNPASEYFNVELTSAKGPIRFYLVNILGEILQQKEIIDASGHLQVQFDLSSCPSGPYLMRIVSNNKTVAGKVQVVH
jgi:hypothetical protein